MKTLGPHLEVLWAGAVMGARDGCSLRREVGKVEGEGGDSAAVGFCPIAAHHCQMNPYL